MLANKLLGASKAATAAANYVEDVFSTWLYTGNGSTQNITNNITFDSVAEFVTPGTYSWTCPAGITSVSAVCVGGGGAGGAAYWAGGGGGGGGLGWKNNIAVTPGTSYTVVVGAGGAGFTANSGGVGGNGGDSYFINTTTVRGIGGQGGQGTSTNTNANYAGGSGGGYVGDGGGTGGTGGTSASDQSGGGGGAGGYSGNGGNGSTLGSSGTPATAGSGGGGGGGGGWGNTGSNGAASSGGGVGIYGQGSNGAAGLDANTSVGGGRGGSGGSSGSNDATTGGSANAGGLYGGGGGGQGSDAKNTNSCNGGSGAVRLVWRSGAAFPTTNVALANTSLSGGMVWIKNRTGTATDHALYDSVRGVTLDIGSNISTAQTTQTTGLTAFNSDGFSIGSLAKLNTNAVNYASWAFRKQAKFFDVVTYTGNGTARTIAHNLGSTPGCVIVKRTDSTGNWAVYHRGLSSASENIYLNLTNAAATASSIWNSTAPTSTVFSVGTATAVNANGGTYVAYLFAHDAGGFGAAGTDNVITCGTYLGSNHRAKEIVTLGYEPQWVMVKNISSDGNSWVMTDIMRNMSVDTAAPQRWLLANSSAVESTATTDQVVAASTGFYFNSVQSDINETGATFVYIAIRRPMKTPTSGTSVFSPVAYTGDGTNNRAITTGFVSDMVWWKSRSNGTDWKDATLLIGKNRALTQNTTDAEGSVAGYYINTYDNTGFTYGTSDSSYNTNTWTYVVNAFRRAPGFFDVVCYTGTGSSTTQAITHNLTVAPELIINKPRNVANGWTVWSSGLGGNDKWIPLETNNVVQTSSVVWNNTAPTATTFTVGQSNQTNGLGTTYVTYLFATVPGVSKVGSYTGTGTTQVINCGFTAGSRFVMIKRTDSAGDWYVWDTARGIISGNDPYLLLNSTAAEVTNTDYIDPANSGFEISSTAPAAINANGGTFIFLAIA